LGGAFFVFKIEIPVDSIYVSQRIVYEGLHTGEIQWQVRLKYHTNISVTLVLCVIQAVLRVGMKRQRLCVIIIWVTYLRLVGWDGGNDMQKLMEMFNEDPATFIIGSAFVIGFAYSILKSFIKEDKDY